MFQVGTTQSIAGLLEIVGTTGKPIQFRSGTLGQVANINLLPGGTQSILHVGVTDVWATGQHLAPNQTNEGGGGNAFNWFGPPLDIGGPPTTPDTDARRRRAARACRAARRLCDHRPASPRALSRAAHAHPVARHSGKRP